MKKLLLLFISVFFIASLYSQPVDETNHNNNYIGIVFYNENSMISRAMADELMIYSKNKTPVKIVFSENSQYKQNDMIEEFLDDKYCKVVIIQLVDASAAGLVLRKADEAKKPIIFVNQEPHFESLRQQEESYYVGSSSEESGRLQGKMIAKYWFEHKDEMDKNGDNVLQYFLISGNLGEKFAVMRSEYVINTLVESGIEVERVGKAVGDWTEESGKSALTKNFGTISHNVEVVIANSDQMALGAVEALKDFADFGFTMVPVFGIGGIDEALESIEEGYLTGTIIVDYKAQSHAAYNLALTIMLGLPVTEENIRYELDKNNAVWIPYRTI